mmetsp:Transcript_96982/g.230689  ORF Transcript_96982/g.230689 Transcript_96982/m.230689 type:complete len:237 (-) Transcript_96982:2641-3351(-)
MLRVVPLAFCRSQRPADGVHEARNGLVGPLVLAVILVPLEGNGGLLHLQHCVGPPLAVLLADGTGRAPLVEAHAERLGLAIHHGPVVLVHGILNAHDIPGLELHLRQLLLLHSLAGLEEARPAQVQDLTTATQRPRIEGSGDDLLHLKLRMQLVLNPLTLKILLPRVRDLVWHAPIVLHLSGAWILESLPAILLRYFLPQHPVQGHILLQHGKAARVPLRAVGQQLVALLALHLLP